jgi:hypothetical protein
VHAPHSIRATRSPSSLSSKPSNLGSRSHIRRCAERGRSTLTCEERANGTGLLSPVRDAGMAGALLNPRGSVDFLSLPHWGARVDARPAKTWERAGLAAAHAESGTNTGLTSSTHRPGDQSAWTSSGAVHDTRSAGGDSECATSTLLACVTFPSIAHLDRDGFRWLAFLWQSSLAVPEATGVHHC